MQYRHTSLEINLNNIAHNIKQFQKILPKDSEIMAVVKADGYGHGAVKVLNKAVSVGVKWAGVALVEEAIELRENGFKLPIFLLGSWFPEAMEAFYQFDITPIVYSAESLQILNEFTSNKKQSLKIHLKIDTGMSRLGFKIDELLNIFTDKTEFRYIEIEGLLTHLSSSDEDDTEFSTNQINDFYNALNQLKLTPKWLHIANSAGAIKFNKKCGNLFRLGISLYGQPPATNMVGAINLKEAVTFKTSIVQLKWIKKNTPVSYNRTFYTNKDTLIATLPVGYADGYSRHLSNKAEVIIRGQRAKLIGRVCMDMIMIDATDINDVTLGDEVILIGNQGDQTISATEIAELCGTINYEITCNISKRVPRIYKD